MDPWQSDLMEEARALWNEQHGDPGALSGVRSREYRVCDLPVTEVEVLDERGAEALRKPTGRYLTLTVPDLTRRDPVLLRRSAEAVSQLLRSLLPREMPSGALVIGLGNRAVTPDIIGPRTADRLLITRHLIEQLPEQFGQLQPVSALSPGVLGTTGMESGVLAKAAAEELHPSVLIAVDALCARSPHRLGTTIQLSDTGIVPGSGAGNARHPLTKETLGVPVIAVGVPTVIWGDQLLSNEDDTESARLLVTPKSIDLLAEILSEVLALGISAALQPDLTLEEVAELCR